MPPRVRTKTASAKTQTAKSTSSRRKSSTSVVVPPHPYLSGNALVCGDNLDILKELPDGCIDLIYLDPPFNSNQFYVAAFGDKGTVEKQLKDIWRWTVESENSFQRLPHGKLLDCLRGIRLQAGDQSPMAAYCVFMGRRLEQIHRVLKPTGSVYLHCDPHANAYLRILMDAVFGTSNFRNEIIWCYAGGGIPKRDLPRKHDTILRYTKTGKYKYNPVYRPYSPGTVERGRTAVKGKYFEQGLREQGTPINDWWTDVPKITSPTDPEKVGYPTQKPLALLDRILTLSSEKGEIVLDPFCGCGTAADAAAKLGRKYLGIDIRSMASAVRTVRRNSFRMLWR